MAAGSSAIGRRSPCWRTRAICSSGAALSQTVTKDDSRRSKVIGSATMPPPVARIIAPGRAAISRNIACSAAQAALAVEADDLADRKSMRMLDLAVELDEGPAEPLGRHAAERRLAGAAQSDQG